MEPYHIKLIETFVVIIFYFIVRKICFKIIDRTLGERFLQEARGILLKRVVHTLLLFGGLLLLLLVWGVKQADLAVFVGSILTVVGVAFFAQWSILSNITSSIILFFNHPIRINDLISIMEGKDYVVEGKVVNIGLFFTTIQTAELEDVTLPNNVFIQKSIKKISEFSTRPKPEVENEPID